MVRIGVAGCGDVATRTYLPVLQGLAPEAEVVAVFDPATARAETAAAMFPGATAAGTYDDLVATPGLEALIILTPAPFHFATTKTALEAGLHVLVEKPIADTLEDAATLAAIATERGKLLLCAPAILVTPRFRTIRRLVADGAIGRVIMATAQLGTMGPAGWDDYTGDPAVFYSKSVGPNIDLGVYAITAVTGLLGPARRVQAMGGISIPVRTITIPRLAGQTVTVETPDNVLMSLDFGENRFAQIFASFAIPSTNAPALEFHGDGGTISIPRLGDWWGGARPFDLYTLPGEGREGSWRHQIEPETGLTDESLLASGPRHLLDCLAGRAEPVMTAAHATHVLEVMRAAQTGIETGRAVDITTTFTLPPPA